MKLELATKQYIQANENKGSAQLISAAKKAIAAGKAEWEKVLTAVLAALIEDFGNEIAEDLGGELKYKLTTCPECGYDKLDIDGDYFVCVKCKEKFIPEHKWTFDPMSVAARAWIVKNGAASVKTILATNLDDVKRIILAGVDENLNTPQIARNLRQFYTDRSSFKAMRVARTEVTKASSFGNMEAAKQSGIVKTKTWLTSRDDRVRVDHETMDGETVKLDDTFSNGLEYPSEPMCRCVLTFQTGR